MDDEERIAAADEKWKAGAEHTPPLARFMLWTCRIYTGLSPTGFVQLVNRANKDDRVPPAKLLDAEDFEMVANQIPPEKIEKAMLLWDEEHGSAPWFDKTKLAQLTAAYRMPSADLPGH